MRYLPILFLAACTGLFEPSEPEPGSVPWALTFMRALGDAAVRVDGTAAIQKYAPEAMPLVDIAPTDGVVTIAELEQVAGNAQDPEQLAWLVTVVYAMMRERE